MLTSLSIQNIVLIDHLTLDCQHGFYTLTGETGAGKSILLDSLSLALGMRADIGLVRHGCDKASVCASFDVPANHPALMIMDEQDLSYDGGELILRRILQSDGKSRAFINDQAVSAKLLKKIGAELVEMHGQFDTSTLKDSQNHLDILDQFGQCQTAKDAVKKAYSAWHTASKKLQAAHDDIAKAKADEEYLQHLFAELQQLAPEEGEEEKLTQLRQRHMHREKIIEAVQQSTHLISQENGIEDFISQIQGALSRLPADAADNLQELVDTIDRAANEIAEAQHQFNALGANMDGDDLQADDVEERLFALKDCARKHHCDIGALPEKLLELESKLSLIENQTENITKLEQDVAQSLSTYQEKAQKLSAARQKAASALDKAVMAELPPLKLEKAKFHTDMVTATDTKPTADGNDQITFMVATNPGTPPAPLSKAASGGELARFMLALKVNLAQSSQIQTLIFDEVDTGVGGATADAIGERMSRLAQNVQILVITHSPQVAAAGTYHWKISKSQNSSDETVTNVKALSNEQRLEEVARMLAGAEITSEARAAAQTLLKTAQKAA